MTPSERMDAYQAAYRAANEGREIEVHYGRGWYSVFRVNAFGYNKYRARELEAMTSQLIWRARRAKEEQG